ncbi:peptide ligase PGM1-related protein [Streptomyces maoxianensis]|uniref:Peptide ligase PGM1-related protein n=1 Tax=Streptomyces maoxianensis TaxID=1459942 RepID=A0ABV9G0J8_9ACTN
MEHREPWIIYANFLSEVAVDLASHEVLEQWAAQAPRKIWLARPGDVLVSPVPLSLDFRRYAGELLGMPYDSVAVVTVPATPGVPMAEAVRRAGLMDELRALIAERAGAGLLPTALDVSSVALAAELEVPVVPYGPGAVGTGALDVTSRLNTKSGFRAAARDLGMRLPSGQVCRRDRLTRTVAELLARHERVVVKPDRSAGGHGVRFVSRAEHAAASWERDWPAGLVGVNGDWVVEQCLDVARSVSVQLEACPGSPRPMFSGEMRTCGGSFNGYVSPLADLPQDCANELGQWGLALGRHLAGQGYAGPYGLDAVLASDGRLYATESNVRRTATTTPHAMVGRLCRAAGLSSPAWLIANRRSRAAYGFADAVKLVRAAGLDWNTARKEGVVLYADVPADGVSWRYAVIGADHRRTADIEARLARVMELLLP